MVDDRADDTSDVHEPQTEETSELTVGEQLRAARELAGLSLADIASRTRITMRHLEAIESSDFGALPGATYSLGFARSYAKAVGLDAVALTDALRTELAQGGHQASIARQPAYEPTDPARVPSRGLAWGAAGLAALLAIAYFIWRSFALSPTAEAPKPPAKAVAEAPIGAASPAAKTGPSANSTVVLTAQDSVWVKIYDADDKRIYENEMKAGDSFTVPADANNPMIVTGRPQVLTVTVDGKAVPPLGTGERSIVDVGVSAAALLSRKPQPPQTATAPTQASGGNDADGSASR